VSEVVSPKGEYGLRRLGCGRCNSRRCRECTQGKLVATISRARVGDSYESLTTMASGGRAKVSPTGSSAAEEGSVSSSSSSSPVSSSSFVGLPYVRPTD
jgi:hypothetical protein